MEEAGAVVALIALEWTIGSIAVGAWTQSWGSIKRGHFRILAWSAFVAAAVALAAARAAGGGVLSGAAVAAAAGAGIYLASQYLESDKTPVVAGASATVAGLIALSLTVGNLGDWPVVLALFHLAAGTAILGGVTNGMFLGHWYLNQPGLKPEALARLSNAAFVSTTAAAVAGGVSAPRLLDASTEGAVLGLPGFGASFGPAFFGIWAALVVVTGGVIWMARRCVSIRSIQSATGLYYVALLTAGVTQFLVTYLVVRSA